MAEITTPERGAAPEGMPRQFRPAFIGLVTVVLLASLNQSLVATALGTIAGELNGVDNIGWVTTTFILALTITMPIYGRLSDLLGRKVLLLCGIVLFTIGSAIAAVAQNMPTMIVARAIEGVGVAGVIICSQAVLADIVPPRQRAKYMAWLGASIGASGFAGPLLGGYITDTIGWRWIFGLNVPVGVLAFVVCTFSLRVPRRITAVKIDYLGIVLLGAAAACTVLLGDWGGTKYAWTSPQILFLAALGLLTWVLFFLSQRYTAEPVMPLRLLRNRIFITGTLIGMLGVGIGSFSVNTYMPTYIQIVYGESATAAGLLVTPMLVGLTAAVFVSGRLISRTGHYKVWPIVGMSTITVTALLLATMDVSTPLTMVCVYLFLMGAGVGMIQQNLILIVQNAFPISDVGTATSSTNFFREIGSALGAAAIGAGLSHRLATSEDLQSVLGNINSITPELVKQLPAAVQDVVVEAYQQALTPGYLYLVPIFAIALAVAFLLPQKKLEDRMPPDMPEDGPGGPPDLPDMAAGTGAVPDVDAAKATDVAGQPSLAGTGTGTGSLAVMEDPGETKRREDL